MNNSWLLGALVALLVVEPFLSEETSTRWAFDVLLTAVLFAAIWTVGQRRRLLVFGLLLVMPALAGRWWIYLAPSPSIGLLSMFFVLAFLVYVVVVVLAQVLRSVTVTRDTLAGAICVYLLLGLVWAVTFALIELVHPGSFQFGGQPLAASALEAGARVREFLYLSLVTLATVGYGDVVPVTAVARRIAVLEAIVGQLYLAVLIARLVSAGSSSPDRSAPR